MIQKRILIINIFGIGDVLFTTPMLNAIKKNDPDCYIGYLANKRTAKILSNNPNIDKVFVYEKDDFRIVYSYSKTAFIKKVGIFLKEIRRYHFDTVVDLSLNTYANFFLSFIGAKKRTGFNYKNRSFLLNDKIPLKRYEGKHVIEYYCSILEHIGIPVEDKHLQLFIKDIDDKWAEMFLKENGIQKGARLIAIAPGGGASWGRDSMYKRWPAKYYADLADKVIEKLKLQVILIGSVDEEKLCQSVISQMRSKPIDASGKTSVTQSAALYKKCKAAVVNDGGPLHIATAVGTKTVSIFGPVDENVYGPYPKDNHAVVTLDLPCRPCYRSFKMVDCEHHSCINKIDPEVVFKKLQEML